jgi:mannose-6-phosphate isomerase class I
LQRYHPQAGECYFVPAGTIHALGGGLVVLEVQETSDATFRLYDWGRIDAAGKPRPLHVEAGLACLKESVPEARLQEPQPLPGQDGGERLVACDYFHLNRCLLSRPMSLQGPIIWVGLRGRARAVFQEGEFLVPAGQLIFIPARVSCTIEPERSCLGAWITFE